MVGVSPIYVFDWVKRKSSRLSGNRFPMSESLVLGGGRKMRTKKVEEEICSSFERQRGREGEREGGAHFAPTPRIR